MSYEIIRPIKKSDDLSLQVLGKLLVISPIKKDTGKKCIWLCVCHCGAVVSRTFNVLKRARRHTCGCLSGNVRHGATGTSEYQIWHSMKARCTNPLAANFQWFGREQPISLAAAVDAGKRAAQVLASAPELLTAKEAGKKGGRGKRVTNLVSLSNGGNDRLAARLKRGHP